MQRYPFLMSECDRITLLDSSITYDVIDGHQLISSVGVFNDVDNRIYTMLDAEGEKVMDIYVAFSTNGRLATMDDVCNDIISEE